MSQASQRRLIDEHFSLDAVTRQHLELGRGGGRSHMGRPDRVARDKRERSEGVPKDPLTV